ncbi:hypothetical protein HK104_007416 [Borealophlyctis nickersoniae]|nr:hypothetical protein HK104_007416 [Borealophlyctis nickersoniae]
MEGFGTRDDNKAVLKRRKRPTDVTRATLLGVCGAEVDILTAILNYLRSRFDYNCLGASCKALHRTMMQTPIHWKWFVQYCREEWFAEADGEESHSKVSPYQIDEAAAARLNCNYRNLIKIGELTVLRDCDCDSHNHLGALSKFLEPAGCLKDAMHSYDVRLLSPSNLFDAGDHWWLCCTA